MLGGLFCCGQLLRQCEPSEVSCIMTDESALIQNERLFDVRQPCSVYYHLSPLTSFSSSSTNGRADGSQQEVS